MTSLKSRGASGPWHLRLGRAASRVVPLLAVAGMCAALALGAFPAEGPWTWVEVAGLAALLLAASLAAGRRMRRTLPAGAAALKEELELGAISLTCAFVLVRFGGEAWFPLLYLVMAFLVSFFTAPAAAALLALSLVFDALLTLPARPGEFLARACFLALFAVLYRLVLASRLALARQAEAQAVQARVRELEERARTFRLVSSGAREAPSADEGQDEKWLVAAVREVDGATGSVLEIAERALRAHTVGVFLLSADDRTVKLHDCRSRSELVQRERFSAREGFFAAVLKRAQPLRLHHAQGLKGVTHYEAGGPTVRALLGVPLLERGGAVRGLLVADRLQEEPFGDDDEALLVTLGAEVLRAMEVERVMTYIRRSRDENERFFRVIEELNRVTQPGPVFTAVVEGAKAVLPALDFCAVTLVEASEGGGRTHTIARALARTPGKSPLDGRRFPDNAGLVANVVRYGAPLPGRDAGAMDRQIIFDEETQVRGLGSLKIVPLSAGDRILGTLVCGSRRRGALDGDEVRMLEVIAIQAAQAILRAQLYAQMETMATTDGLTGLLNHRTFQTRFDEALGAARRYRRSVALLLTDIDHFKSVNDTHGHPAGDAVLRGVARLLREEIRDTDLAARYGGEEFAVIMPETDAAGALVIAERIRQRIEREVFPTEQGPLRVTLSLGVSAFPEDGADKAGLVSLADRCLYFAKRHGRNQSVTVARMQGKVARKGWEIPAVGA